jgi:signal transduction histidine kinase/DNA-binding response OmpR family regulator
MREGGSPSPQAIPRRQWLLYLLLAALAGGSAGFSAVELRAGGSGWLLVASLIGLGLVVLASVRRFFRFRLQVEPVSDSRTNTQPTNSSEAEADPSLLGLALTAGRIGVCEWLIATGRLTWSENVPELLGLSGPPAQPTLEDLLAATVPEDRQALRSALQAAMDDPSRQDTYLAEFRVPIDDRSPRRDGEVRWLEARGRVFRDSNGKALRLLGTLRDGTPRRRELETLRAASAAAESANAAKSRFLANVGHELRTPVAGILGLAELLQETPVNDEQRDYLRTLSRSADGLLALLNDLLDFSKIEAGKLEMDSVPFTLSEAVADAVSVFSLPAQSKGLILTTRIDPSLPPRLIGDPYRLRQVLLNLIGNGIKFTEKGEVVVEVKTAEEFLAKAQRSQSKTEEEAEKQPISSLSSFATFASLRETLLRFSVTDTGIGIQPEKQASIFQPFVQAERGTASFYGGTGLGLTISVRLVEMMGGRLSMESEVGRGSTFWFTVPLRVDETTRVTSAGKKEGERDGKAQDGRSLRILLAEDNPVNQQVLTLLLEKTGHQVRAVGNGREALEALENEKFDLVLMDVQMPEMDGLRATRLLRAREKAIGGRVPVVAVTANMLDGERQRCLTAGMDDYLAKPIRKDELLATIHRVVGQPPPPPESTEQMRSEGPAWLSLLRGQHLDETAIASLARTFMETAPARLSTLRQAVADADAARVETTAHTLKGSLAIFAARAAGEAAACLEQLGRAGQLDQAAEQLATLETEMRTLEAELTSFLQSAS